MKIKVLEQQQHEIRNAIYALLKYAHEIKKDLYIESIINEGAAVFKCPKEMIRNEIKKLIREGYIEILEFKNEDFNLCWLKGKFEGSLYQ